MALGICSAQVIHVVTGADDALIDGSVITGGHAEDGGDGNKGGGMYNLGVSPTVANCVFVGNWALGQLWLFWVAPIIGAILGAVAYKAIAGKSAK